MKLLFLTTYGIDINKEHIFTKNVWKYLSQYYTPTQLILGSCIIDEQKPSPYIEEKKLNGFIYYLLYTQSAFVEDNLKKFFQHISPSIIHSNMIEGYDIEAARGLGIPIVLTIHIGGIICPRGGGNGFLMYNDSICNQPVSNICMKCGCMDLPLPCLSYALLKLLPKSILEYIYSKIKDKNLFYITPFINKFIWIQNRKKYIQFLSYAHVIVANYRLVSILKMNGIPEDNIHLIPHGVKDRGILPFPDYSDNKVKFYYLGRVQYSKGLHILMKAFDGIDKSKYELHIIGDAELRRKEQRYYSHIKSLAKNKNVIFHGRLPNDRIEEVVQDCHVMIHSAIYLEVYGIAIAESLSMGRPVLATKCGGAEMQIKDGVNGWLVEPNSVSEMRNKILYIIDHFDDVCSCAKNSRIPHPIEEYCHDLQFIYNDILIQ